MKSLKSFMEAKHKKKMDPVDDDELKGDHKDREDKDIDNDGDEDESDEYLHKRRKAIKNKVDEDVEQIDELSKKTLGSYARKAVADIRSDAHWKGMNQAKGNPPDVENNNRLNRRRKFTDKAIVKLAKEDVQLDELSKKTLGSYVKKAASDVGYSAETSNTKKELKRHKGIAKAADKLTKEDVQWPVYMRLMEKTKQPNDSGIPAQPADDIASKGAKDFMAQHGDRKPEDYVDIDKVLDMNKQDMYRNLPNKSKGRPNDQKVGQPSADKSNGKDKL